MPLNLSLGITVAARVSVRWTVCRRHRENEIIQMMSIRVQEVRSIDLSCNRNISVTQVTKFLDLYPNITTLIALHTPNLAFENLSKALMGRH